MCFLKDLRKISILKMKQQRSWTVHLTFSMTKSIHYTALN